MSAADNGEYLLGICDGVNPFAEWTTHGELRTWDGTDTTTFGVEDVAEVLHEGSSGEMWDGTVAAVIRLRDGRFVAWETFYGPTGDGFNGDAYGGDADITFGSTFDSVVRWGLTDEVGVAACRCALDHHLWRCPYLTWELTTVPCVECDEDDHEVDGESCPSCHGLGRLPAPANIGGSAPAHIDGSGSEVPDA